MGLKILQIFATIEFPLRMEMKNNFRVSTNFFICHH